MKLDDASKRGVRLDQYVKDSAKKTKIRIIAERDLRFLLDDYQVMGATKAEVKNLQEYLIIAKESGVAENYLEEAETLKRRMSESIKVDDIFKEFQAYPKRGDYYPEFKYPKKFVFYDHVDKKKFRDLFHKRKRELDKKILPKYGITPELQNML